MICPYCKEREATIHYTEVINGNVNKIHICEECAKKKGIDAELPFSFSDVFSALSKGIDQITQSPAAATDAKLACPVCSMQIQDLLKQGRMGCAECYETFEAIVKDILHNVQKSPSHIGKTPKKFVRSADVKRRITEREKALKQAISEERYEDCVILRDEIRKLKEVLSTHDNA